MTKKIEVTSIDTKTFMEVVFEMFKLGAKYNGGLAVKRPILGVHLEIDESVVVPDSPCIRVIPEERVKAKLNVKAPKPAQQVKRTTKRDGKQTQGASPKQAPKKEKGSSSQDSEKEATDQDVKE